MSDLQEFKYYLTPIVKSGDQYAFYVKKLHLEVLFNLMLTMNMLKRKNNVLLEKHPVIFTEERLSIYDNVFRSLSFDDKNKVFNIDKNPDQEDYFLRIKGKKRGFGSLVKSV